MPDLQPIDLLVVLAYIVGVLGISLWFLRRSSNASAFMAADRNLPGWAVGLSIFGSYISSISFLANPGKSYDGNWGAFVFNLTTPLAAVLAVVWFVPFYRRHGHVSAYEHLERRFGAWARIYAVSCFLLIQVTRVGTITYLLATALVPLTGLEVRPLIAGIGALMTAVALMGGMKAVIWAGVAQSAVLIAGLVACVAALWFALPDGLGPAIELAAGQGKFSLAPSPSSAVAPTLLALFLYGLTINTQNFAIDQSYVQRYIAARSEKDAKRSVWMAGWMYVPVGAGFFFIGTMLYVLYAAYPARLGSGITPDQVFPHFIATELPPGLRGLVLAALLAAATDSNLGNMATLTLCDLYTRFRKREPGPRESITVLRVATLFWGVLGTVAALAMIREKPVLDAWWKWAGVFSGGMLGLFLLGLLVRRAGGRAAAVGVLAGLMVIVWMTISPTSAWPEAWARYRSPLHDHWTIVLGTLTVFAVGALAATVRPQPPDSVRQKIRGNIS